MKHIRITNISNHLSTRKLNEIACDKSYNESQRVKAKKLLLKRGGIIKL